MVTHPLRRAILLKLCALRTAHLGGLLLVLDSVYDAIGVEAREIGVARHVALLPLAAGRCHGAGAHVVGPLVGLGPEVVEEAHCRLSSGGVGVGQLKRYCSSTMTLRWGWEIPQFGDKRVVVPVSQSRGLRFSIAEVRIIEMRLMVAPELVVLEI